MKFRLLAVLTFFLVSLLTPVAAQDCVACSEVDGKLGWYGEYYNYPSGHPDMNLTVLAVDFDSDHGHPLGEWDTDWYEAKYHRFSRVDSNLAFGADFFPMDELAEDIELSGHDYHFGVHWRASVEPSEPGDYNVQLQSDDDSWVYLDGKIIISNPGLHDATPVFSKLYLTGVHTIDIFFAERKSDKSHFFFAFDDPSSITITPLPPGCEDPACDDPLPLALSSTPLTEDTHSVTFEVENPTDEVMTVEVVLEAEGNAEVTNVLSCDNIEDNACRVTLIMAPGTSKLLSLRIQELEQGVPVHATVQYTADGEAYEVKRTISLRPAVDVIKRELTSSPRKGVPSVTTSLLTKPLLGTIVLGVIGGLFAGSAVMRKRKQKKRKATSPADQLGDYVKNTRKKGFSDAQIRKKLITSGWEREVVDDILERTIKK